MKQILCERCGEEILSKDDLYVVKNSFLSFRPFHISCYKKVLEEGSSKSRLNSFLRGLMSPSKIRGIAIGMAIAYGILTSICAVIIMIRLLEVLLTDLGFLDLGLGLALLLFVLSLLTFIDWIDFLRRWRHYVRQIERRSEVK